MMFLSDIDLNSKTNHIISVVLCLQIPIPQPVYVAPPQNDCCCFCAIPCQFTARTRMHGARIFTAKIAEIEADPSCNNPRLKAIMEKVLIYSLQ